MVASNPRVVGAAFGGWKLRRDTRLGVGSLLLLNPQHGSGRWATGAPLNGALLPNIAYQQARQAIGSGTETELAASWVNAGFVAADGKTERTSKGGVHVLVSQVTDTGGHFQHVDLPAKLTAYLRANPSHSLYMSLIGRTTRVGATSLFARLSSQTGGIVRQSVQEGTSAGSPVVVATPTSGTNLIARSASVPSPNLFVMDIATSDVPSTWTAGSDINPALLFFGPASSSSAHKAPSWVFYNFYLEDLTVSGRTYTQAHADLTASYQAQFVDSGGMYRGDTIPTDPGSFL